MAPRKSSKKPTTVVDTKRTASVEYLDLLKKERDEVSDVLEIYKRDLYEIVAGAMMFDARFETSKKNCYDQTQKLVKVEKEIKRVETSLRAAERDRLFRG